ncbi:hypothetical protein L195_g036555 [Trifolium pratense]|uniref:Uncharacterized protein n=1 Tax=Trifolium pratense TaxID=57577 RepID=A0A2K3LPT0_TRIPR|nr:hypothetical protein L195_g036555 [Trifolium pratense]
MLENKCSHEESLKENEETDKINNQQEQFEDEDGKQFSESTDFVWE